MRIAAIIMAALLSACSMTFQRTGTAPACSTSYGWAAADGVGAAAALSGAIVSSEMADQEQRVGGARADVVTIVPLMIATAVYAGSAMYGAQRAGECRGASASP